MTRRKQKLELTWFGKENRPPLEPRVLVEDPGLLYHAPQRVTENDIFDNMPIHGDNLLALKAWEVKKNKRRKRFDAQDEIDVRQAELINGIERRLRSTHRLETPFCARWTRE